MTATPDTSTHKIGEPLSQEEAIASLGRYGYGWADSDVAGESARRGLSEDVVREYLHRLTMHGPSLPRNSGRFARGRRSGK